jgi:diaminopimelate decarboxylase
MFDKNLVDKFQNIETPFYFYDLDILENNLNILQEESNRYNYKIHYALKANFNPPILELISRYGFGADCVSGNEIKQALDNNFNHQQIVFAGVGKTDKEISFALQNNIQCINCESLEEMRVINKIAKNEGLKARIAIRINPDLEANTHHYITTGKKDNKFGINFTDLHNLPDILATLTHIDLIGLHTHIGSQISDMQIFEKLAVKINDILNYFNQMGIKFDHINLGGGLSIDYQHPIQNVIPDYAEYFRLFHDNLNLESGQLIHFELGRSLVAQCGFLISRVLYVKRGYNTEFVVIDAGMTELIRPALYNAYHKIVNLSSDKPERKYDVVGPVCESSDFLGKNVLLPETRRHDLLAILSAGAYAEVMASRYNLRDKAGAIYSNKL